jgi:hypothetical protein
VEGWIKLLGIQDALAAPAQIEDGAGPTHRALFAPRWLRWLAADRCWHGQCLLRVRRDDVPDLGATFAAALAHLRQLIPLLDERLRGATPVWTIPASVAGLPYGYVCRASDCAEGLYRVGDQLAVIPSFTGGGIAIALRTARLAAEAIMAGVPSREWRPLGAVCAGRCASPHRFETRSRRQLFARAALSFCSMRRRAAHFRPSDPAAGEDRRCSMSCCKPATRPTSLGWRRSSAWRWRRMWRDAIRCWLYNDGSPKTARRSSAVQISAF